MSIPASVEPEAPSSTRIYGSRRLPSQTFVGRDEVLEQLEDLLVRKGESARILASIAGLAGVGKTELALQFVERAARKGAFSGGIYWLEAEDPDLTLQWGSRIANQRGTTRDDDSPKDRAAATIREIEQLSNPVLIVLDNVTEWTSSQQPRPRPDGARVQLLVTTRQKDLGGSAFKEVSLEVLDTTAARTLLEKTTGRGPLEGAEALLEYLDGHALGIELAGAYMRRYNASPAGYLAKLYAGEAGAGEQRAAKSVRYERTVNMALATVWERLDHDVRQAWLTATQFADAPATTALAEAAGIDAEERADLRALHLIRSESDDRWTMHRLVRAFGRQAGDSDARRDAQQRFLSACVKEAKPMDFVLGFQRYRGDQPHFDRAVNTDPASFEDTDAHTRLLDRIATALQSAGDYEGAKDLFEQALESDLKTYGPQHPQVATDRNNLAPGAPRPRRPSRRKGDVRAGARVRPQNRRPPTSPSRHLPQQPGPGAPRPRRPSRRKGTARASARVRPQNLRPPTSQGRHYAATTWRLVLRALGDLQGAKARCYEQALESDLKTYGPQHPEVAILTATTWRLVLQDLGDLQGAKELLEQALESNLKTYGPQHPQVATCRNNLGGGAQRPRRPSRRQGDVRAGARIRPQNLRPPTSRGRHPPQQPGRGAPCPRRPSRRKGAATSKRSRRSGRCWGAEHPRHEGHPREPRNRRTRTRRTALKPFSRKSTCEPATCVPCPFFDITSVIVSRAVGIL